MRQLIEGPSVVDAVADAMAEAMAEAWQGCRFMSCSVLPVRVACNLSCPFCFSKSSMSSLKHERTDWRTRDVEKYYRFAKLRGANRLVITGGGEPLLKPNDVVDLVRRGSQFFDEIALFTNGTFLTSDLSLRLVEAGLSYICYSRHHFNDQANRHLMGDAAPDLIQFVAAAGDLPIRATCVMAKGWIDSIKGVDEYIDTLGSFGVRQFTFKHTYVAYGESFFKDSPANDWSRRHQVEWDPFECRGDVIAELPWGPKIRKLGPYQVCYYFEPTPKWELENQTCRSSNLLSDGAVYASLEDQRSRLFHLNG